MLFINHAKSAAEKWKHFMLSVCSDNLNRLSANSTKFDHFVGFELEGLRGKWLRTISSSFLYRYAEVLW